MHRCCLLAILLQPGIATSMHGVTEGACGGAALHAGLWVCRHNCAALSGLLRTLQNSPHCTRCTVLHPWFNPYNHPALPFYGRAAPCKQVGVHTSPRSWLPIFIWTTALPCARVMFQPQLSCVVCQTLQRSCAETLVLCSAAVLSARNSLASR
jgi:hypothetical protein